ncbi:substrate-binding domain-containing protein [bacterium]|nr:substrate-binding domain-containing protein [bacterium]
MEKSGKEVVVVAPSFQTVFHSMVYAQFDRLFKTPVVVSFRSITDETSMQREHLKWVLGHMHPNILIAASICPDNDTVAAYASSHIPILLIDEKKDGLTSVSTDNYAGGRMAAEYLISKGRKNLAIVSGRINVRGGYNAEQRVKGFQDSFRAAGPDFSIKRVFEVKHYSQDEGAEVVPFLLEKGVDAVFCAAGDDCAIGLMKAAMGRGIRIPDDIAVVGFDDILAARVFHPPLTTLKQPLEKITQTVADLIMKDEGSLLKKPQTILCVPELMIRQSA